MMTNWRVSLTCFVLFIIADVSISPEVLATDPDLRLMYVNSKTEFVSRNPEWNSGEVCVVSQDGKNVYAVRAGQLIIYDRNHDNGTLKLVKFSRPRGAGTVAIGPDNETLLIGGGRWLITYQRDPETGLVEMRQEIKGPVFSTDTGVYGLDSFNSVVNAFDACAVYLTSPWNQAVLEFSRNIETGLLEHVQTFQDDEAYPRRNNLIHKLSEKIPGAITLTNLAGCRGAAISRDGRYLYVATMGENGVAMFERDADSQHLKPAKGLYEQQGRCDYGLILAHDVVISPDDRHLYVASVGDSVSTFRRDAQSGELSFIEAHYNDENGMKTIGYSTGIAITPDGRNVLVVSHGRNHFGSISHFRRNIEHGWLEFVGAITEDEVPELSHPTRVVVSPDGKNVYTCSQKQTVGVFRLEPVRER